MGFSVATKNQALDAITIDKIKLHSGDPGAAGTTAVIAGAEAACAYDPAVNGVRDLTATVQVPIALVEPDNNPIQVSHYSVWEANTFKGGFIFVSNPETYSNDGFANIPSAPITMDDAA